EGPVGPQGKRDLRHPDHRRRCYRARLSKGTLAALGGRPGVGKAGRPLLREKPEPDAPHRRRPTGLRSLARPAPVPGGL
ncbi:MAG: hypothetical protein AVDCRST_MAG01-01-4815, partial [uncultured Rubrobacteraceae bacterium]